MKQNLIRLAVTVGSITLTSAPLLALALYQPAPNTSQFGLEGVLQVICRVVDVLFSVLVLVALVYVVLAAFKYLTAGGDPEKVKTANYQLIYAAVAIGIGILARALPLAVSTFIVAGGGVGSC